MSTERWKRVVDWEGRYEVSSFGRIRSVGRTVAHGRGGGSRQVPARIMKPALSGPSVGQYFTLMLSRDGQQKSHAVHILACRAFHGPKPDPSFEVRHLDGNSQNNAAGNLAWGTRQANVQDCIKHGRNGRLVKKACPYGHLLVVPNLTAGSIRAGRRNCLACSRARAKVSYERSQGRSMDRRAVAAAHYAKIMQKR